MSVFRVGEQVRINGGQFYGQTGRYCGPDLESRTGRQCVKLEGLCGAFGVQSFPESWLLPLTANNGD